MLGFVVGMTGANKRGKKMAVKKRRTSRQQDTVVGGVVKGWFLQRDESDFEYAEKRGSFRPGPKRAENLCLNVAGTYGKLSTHLEFGRLLPGYEFVADVDSVDGGEEEADEDEHEDDDGEEADEEMGA
jgi:hypothetical protein